MSLNLSHELQEATKRRNLMQKEIARETYLARSTINGYFKGSPVPMDKASEIANFVDDSLLALEVTHKAFGTFPAMQSDVYQEAPIPLSVIQAIELQERKEAEQAALVALSKEKDKRTEEDNEVIVEYAMNFLDEVFIETRFITAVFEEMDRSIMSAIDERKRHWKERRYLK